MPKADLTGVPGGYEVWKVAGHTYLVYIIPGKLPGTNNPKLGYRVTNDEWARISGGKGFKGKVDRRMGRKKAKRLGMIGAGPSTELANLGNHPWGGVVKKYRQAARLRPWLKRDEMVGIWAEAYLEGREITDTELKNTRWWRKTNPEERAWVELVNSDPKAAKRRQRDNRLKVRASLTKMGIQAPNAYVNLLADRYTRGTYTEAQLQNHLNRRNDPYVRGASTLAGVSRDAVPNSFKAVKHKGRMYLRTAHGDFELEGDVAQARFGGKKSAKNVKGVKKKGGNKKLADYLMVHGYGATIQGEEEVKQLFEEYLGPYSTQGYSKNQFGKWASKLLNEETGRDDLINHLTERAANVLTNYSPGTTYEDAAAQWRQTVQEVWGQVPDEADQLFWDIVRNNDMTYAQQRLREEGINRGIKTVQDQLQSDILRISNNGIRGAL